MNVILNHHLIKKALAFGHRGHDGQVRRESGLPYIYHTIEVALLLATVKRLTRIIELVCAAILHDLLEDTNISFHEIATEFTPMVASLVLELSSDKEEVKRAGKNNYLKKKLVGLSNYGLLLKLADRLANVGDNPRVHYLIDTRDLIEHVTQNRKLTTSQQWFADAIKDVLDRELGNQTINKGEAA